MNDHFSIGLCAETMSFFPELLFQLKIVFDNPVVDNNDGARAILMGMGILFRGTAVRCPASMSYPVASLDRR